MSRALALGALVFLIGCSGPSLPTAKPEAESRLVSAKEATIPVSGVAAKIVAAAKAQLSWGTHYDNRYAKLSYPNGDLPKDRGVCTDVVIRALRPAGYDLQKLIHEDMQKAWEAYPRYAGNSKPDSNIDHRRVPNQRVFWKRHGQVLTVSVEDPSKWNPGDIVTWKLDNGLDHTGVLSDKPGEKGLPFVVHNLGTTLEEDVLTAWKITGHYRFP